ncbi:VWA domain-containing protein [Aeoliella sp. ICT_H6.2]|uniref:VWA domain-containing protein n=1 Tax=Aeoliella straminimaris TaxID=2954799 RepID=A0A9X2JEX2_9BACT|nr:VWA domain-containing protein [Aeoliella straminimaris]MCO6043450.1 VWA domain-containing protein [Aeoliella straminimaris]
MRASLMHRLPRVGSPRPHDRRGVMVVLVCFLMIALLACVAFSVDVAYLQLTRTKLRAATDAAARAAGEALSREQNLDASRQAAIDIAQSNLVAGDPLLLDVEQDIVFGRSTQQRGGAWSFEPAGEPINAVRVLGRRTRDAPSGSVPTMFGRVFNVMDFQPLSTATVVRLDRDICIVVDRSSSMKLFLNDNAPTMSTSDPRFCRPPDMSQSRWRALTRAFDRFVAALHTTPQDEYLSLASYSSSGTWCGNSNNVADINQQLSADYGDAESAMTTLSGTKFNGATNIGEGIRSGIDALTNPSTSRPFAAKTMVLMTDGNYTQGNRPRDVAPEALRHDIVIHAVTFGDGADQNEMRAVAAATGGNFYHAPDAQTLQDVFEEIALTLPVMFTE